MPRWGTLQGQHRCAQLGLTQMKVAKFPHPRDLAGFNFTDRVAPAELGGCVLILDELGYYAIPQIGVTFTV